MKGDTVILVGRPGAGFHVTWADGTTNRGKSNLETGAVHRVGACGRAYGESLRRRDAGRIHPAGLRIHWGGKRFTYQAAC